MEPLRLLLVADDPLARAGLAVLVADVPGCDVVGQVNAATLMTGSLAEFDQVPDVVIWDVGWEPGETLPEWQELDLPIVALLADESDATAVWAAGVDALLRRDTNPDRLVTAARAVAEGLVVFDPTLAQPLLPATATETTLSFEELTPREAEVLQLLAEGLTNKAIAHRLAISEHTVKYHVNAIMGKLGAQSRTEAVMRATRLGLILL